ncbi:hypothetical protein BLNAU_13821 [Blattamonas nauphoetae]|uniref:Uncharacterized protein n=1 Tax=Blattamonas nauphoetae TaxID=2049346 RepID=A0ABQ9XM36_9EUKA|nr:hypothetical protein BLNAU_13821 [Blattamonas nauphoetae]
MGSSLSHLSQPDTRNLSQPFFTVNLSRITNISDTSPVFLSLVTLVKEGAVFGKSETRKACRLLDKLAPGPKKLFICGEILFDLVPSPNRTCRLFAEAMVSLLSCSNETISFSALSFLDITLEMADTHRRLKLVEAEFFRLLPLSFCEQENHLKHQHMILLVRIIVRCLSQLGDSIYFRDFSVIPEQLPFVHIIFSDLLVPLEGFLRFICRHYSIFDVHNPTSSFVTLVPDLLRYAPCYEELHTFVLPLPLSVAITNCFIHFTTVEMIDQGLSYLRWTLLMWKDGKPEERMRSKDFIASLREEGLDDCLEHEWTLSFSQAVTQSISSDSLEVMLTRDCDDQPVDEDETFDVPPAIFASGVKSDLLASLNRAILSAQDSEDVTRVFGQMPSSFDAATSDPFAKTDQSMLSLASSAPTGQAPNNFRQTRLPTISFNQFQRPRKDTITESSNNSSPAPTSPVQFDSLGSGGEKPTLPQSDQTNSPTV